MAKKPSPFVNVFAEATTSSPEIRVANTGT